MSEPACECPGPGLCPRYGIRQGPFAYAMCQGTACGPQRSDRFRQILRLRKEGVIETPPHHFTPTDVPPREEKGPGTELKKILAELGLTPTAGCSCANRIKLMDTWGVDECVARRDEIIEWLRAEQKRQSRTDRVKAYGRALATGLALKFNPLDPAPGLLDEAVRRAAAGSTIL